MNYYGYGREIIGPKTILPTWRVYNAKRNPKNCILALPGRIQNGKNMAELVAFSCLTDTLIVGITPQNLCWYPMPISSTNQDRAVKGLPYAVDAVDRTTNKIEEKFNIKRNNIALVGWSAGAVTALWSSFKLNDFAAVVSIGGAVLEPHNIPQCENETNYLLIHGLKDLSFDWNERFSPMYRGMRDNGYKTHAAIRREGHQILQDDIIIMSSFLSELFNYDSNYIDKASQFWNQTFEEAFYNYRFLKVNFST